jgi:hypothetical protein
MVVECLVFWLWLWLSIELVEGRFLAPVLVTCVGLIMLLAGVALMWGLDLFAFFVAGIYSAVFIVIFLMVLQFVPF